MSHYDNAISRAVAASRRRHYQPPDPADHAFAAVDALDLGDPVDRAAALLCRIAYTTPDDAASDLNSVDGQVAIARTWARTRPSLRQLYRRRAVAVLDFATNGQELRSRPEDNAA